MNLADSKGFYTPREYWFINDLIPIIRIPLIQIHRLIITWKRPWKRHDLFILYFNIA